MSSIKPHKIFEIYSDGRRLYTKSILPGKKHFDERLFKEKDGEYREFDPTRSKLAAMIKKGGYGLLAVKARSIDIKRKNKDIFIEIRNLLEKEFTVIDYKVLEPFEMDHCMIIVKK